MLSFKLDLTMTSSNDSIIPANSSLRVRSSGQYSQVDELEYIKSCRDAGVVHILGNTVVRARRDSRLIKNIAVDYIYAFLRRICIMQRENSVYVPHEKLRNVSQIYYV
ncbi:Potassium transporter [Ranunculus cassubicifolius]